MQGVCVAKLEFLSRFTVPLLPNPFFFLRHPAPGMRWVGSSRPQSSPEWKPFAEGCRRGRLPTPCRHSHASHSLARGTELTSVRDNLCHASLYTTSIHLHGDEVKRATQIRAAFAERA